MGMFKFNKNIITLFEAFSGIGTQAMALKRLSNELNFELKTIGVSEIDKFAIKSYEAIHGETPNYGSITEIQEIPQVDIFTYSFPCTDISNAGKGLGFEKGSGTRSGLLWEVERILNRQKELNKLPTVLLLENVKALFNKKFISGFSDWLEFLESIGYRNFGRVLNAEDYGIPQHRERIFVVSILGDYDYEFPKGIVLEKNPLDYVRPTVDKKYYLNELNMNLLQYKNFDANKPIQISYAASSREHREQGWIDVFPTLGARDYKDPKIVHYNGNFRKLTPKEYWILMGIDAEDFYKAKAVNSNSQLYKQAGNAIVVDVLYYIFKQLF